MTHSVRVRVADGLAALVADFSSWVTYTVRGESRRIDDDYRYIIAALSRPMCWDDRHSALDDLAALELTRRSVARLSARSDMADVAGRTAADRHEATLRLVQSLCNLEMAPANMRASTESPDWYPYEGFPKATAQLARFGHDTDDNLRDRGYALLEAVSELAGDLNPHAFEVATDVARAYITAHDLRALEVPDSRYERTVQRKHFA